MGAIFQTVIGPSRWNWPRQSSMKKIGSAPNINTVKYGIINAPEMSKFAHVMIKFSTVLHSAISIITRYSLAT